MKRLEGRIAIVSGGAGGIGTEIVRRLVHEGASVLVADILADKAETLAREVGNGSSAIGFDAYDQLSIETMVQTAVDRYDRVDILVNNVADTSLTSLDSAILDTDIATFDRSIASNLRSFFIATKATLPHLLESRGAIINIASAAALVGDTILTSYSTAKAGVLALTRNTAVQYGKQGVRCNSICPGFIAHGRAREMMPESLKSVLEASHTTRNGEPEDIAALVAYLASDEAGFMSGANIVCDGGHSITSPPWRTGPINAI